MRYRNILMLAIGCVCTAGYPAVAQETAPATPGALLRGLLPAVVNITAYMGATAGDSQAQNADASTAPAASRPQVATGSGFIVDPAGYIATNDHVIDGAYRIVVTFSDGKTAPADIVGGTRQGDIALIRVHVADPLPTVHWGNSKKVRIGDMVFAVGDPLGVGLSVSSGIVSALNRNIMDTPYDDFIQTDAAINHGNSGGPLFDMRGDVVGMNAAIISPTTGSAGLGFAIPSDGVQFVVDRLRQYGWIKPGWLGVKIEQVTPEIADALGLADAKGAIVANVTEGGPGSKAGLQVGDIIEKYGDTVPWNEPALLRDIVRTPIGTQVDLAIWRNGKQLILPATIEEWPKAAWDALNAPVQARPIAMPVAPDLGLTMVALPDATRTKLGLVSHQGGVLINSVMANTDAARRGIVAGDVILRVQNSVVGSQQDVLADIGKARAQGHKFATILILPKVSALPGPRWTALRIADD